MVALLLLIVACRNGDDDAAPASTTTVQTSTTESGSQAGSSTTSTAPPPACPDAPPETVAATGPAIPADVDGDGQDDQVGTFPVEGIGTRLRVDLAAGGSVVHTIPAQADHTATVQAAVDLGRDGSDELWVEVGQGASTDIFGLYDLDGCDLEAVQVDGTDAQFGIGGPVLLLQGLRCDDAGRIVHLGATSEDGESFATLDLIYELRDGELVRVDDETGALTAADDELQTYSTFDC
jgi:hypothetical protein